jgi:predicted lipid-binding transport protein (Tim44 family)
MDDGFQLLEILIFAVIAGFLVLRLRSVLGRRTGLEQRRNLFPPAAPPAPAPPAPAPRIGNGTAGRSGVAAIKAADPGFDETSFLEGARGAFGIVVNAFAAGDATALKPLLSKDVFGRFAEAIAARQAAKESLQTTLVAVKAAELVEASLEGATALVTVKFVSDQTNVTRATDGHVIDGDPERVVEHVDLWTFARPVRAHDPNWTLVATQTP